MPRFGFCLGLLVLAPVSVSAQDFVFDNTGHGPKARVTIRRLAAPAGQPAGVEIELDVPKIEIKPGADGFDEVGAAGLSPLAVPGSPALFETGRLVAVPAGYDPVLTVLEKTEKILDQVNVAPFQQKHRCGENGSDPARADAGFSFNSLLYRSLDLFPAKPALMQEVGKVQGLRLVRIALRPLRMHMGKRALCVLSHLKVKVEFRPSWWTSPRRQRLSPSFFRLIQTVAVNGADLPPWVRAAPGKDKLWIVTADVFKEALRPLVEWKRRTGLDVELFTFSEAGGSRRALHNFLQRRYDEKETRPSFLLLVGNQDSLPPFWETTDVGPAPSDLRYTLLDGWDSVPDLFVGRLVADSRADVDAQVSRAIEYEKAPDRSPWFTEGVTIASAEAHLQSDGDYALEVERALRAGKFARVDRFYEEQSESTVYSLARKIQEGRSWISYFGHGDGEAWTSMYRDDFTLAEIDRLENTRLPVVIDVACENGAWTQFKRCFGKAWVTHRAAGRNSGAVAYLGGTVLISWHPPAIMSVGIAKYHFEKGQRTLGASVLAGQFYLLERMAPGAPTLDNLKWFTLFGDPSLVLRTSVPQHYELARDVRPRPGGVELRVKAAGDGDRPISGLICTVGNPRQGVLATSVTGADGTASLRLPDPKESLILTTSGFGLETQENSVP